MLKCLIIQKNLEKNQKEGYKVKKNHLNFNKDCKIKKIKKNNRRKKINNRINSYKVKLFKKIAIYHYNNKNKTK